MAKIKSIRNSIRVLLWGKEIGTLTWNQEKKQSYFFFSPEYFNQAYDLCPITHPKDDNSTRQAIYGPSMRDADPSSKLYQGLPPFLADSLPDAWGNLIFEKWFKDNGIAESEKTAITKLSFIGNRAMGAFEFAPMMDPSFYKDKEIDIAELYKESLIIEEQLSQKAIKREDATINNIAALGTSPGGSRKKAIISIAPDHTIHSGKTATDKDWKHYIIKFNDPRYSISEIEKTYYDLAIDAKIPMMPSCFMEIDGIKHFLTERFDRKDGKKILTQTLAAIDPDGDSYEDLFRTCRKLDIPPAEMTNLFRQTVFNFLMNNTDDHKKNFSFMMDENYKWHLTPAYDLMFIIADNAVSPEKTHCMSLRGKYTGITEDDLIQFAIQNDIKAPESIIKDIRNVSLKFEEYAHANGINGYYTEMISMTLNELGRAKDLHIEKVSTRIGDTELRDIQFEMTTKGNIHLLATIHNKRRKVVITSSKPLYKEIVDNGFNLMSRDKKAKIFQQAFSKLIALSPVNNSSGNDDSI